ncbi:MAG: hypothetical protein LC792_12120 [Actinobacteria bacterium]|nr:hypothetical protein [Actinomycetota bacterium]
MRGELKRLAFLFGLVVLFAGAILLNDPMAVEDSNCGSALMRKTVERRYAERCDAKLDRRRLPGFALVVVGIGAVVTIGPRCLLQPD